MTPREMDDAHEEGDTAGISDLALEGLDALMDHPLISSYCNQVAQQHLGRVCRGEDDDDWYEALGKVYDRLLNEMKKANAVNISKGDVH